MGTEKKSRTENPTSAEAKLPNLGEALKRMVSVGVGAAFLTEDVIRSYLQDIKLPKEVLQLLLQQAGKSKDELLDRIGTETMKIISKIDFVKEASRFVETHKFKVSAEIEVIKKNPRS